ncbi:MAG: hypothetical protein LBV37_01470 [Mycoplasmataceae bacterium]|jgi:alanine dehydrogenase|nr:hypothetical protein [Mycoplasmataceae bacterium]
MKIAILKENKNEYRVSVVPKDVQRFVNDKHTVAITSGAGSLAGFNDDEYKKAGAEIVNTNKIAIKNAQIIFKISSVQPKELKLIDPSQIIISLFNLSNNPKLLKALLKNKNSTLGVEAMHDNGEYVALIPNEQIKGRFGAIVSAYHLSKLDKNGYGKTISPINFDNEHANFVILNASYAGYEAARTILALGGNLTILETNDQLIQQVKHDGIFSTLAHLYNSKFDIVKSDFDNLNQYITKADVLINTNAFPGSLTQKRITEKMISSMHKGAVYVNLASDQGFGAETERKPSTFKKPTFIANNVIHFNIENVASVFPSSASSAVSNAVTNHLLKAIKGENMLGRIKESPIFFNAILTYDGKLTSKTVADSLHLQYTDIKTLIK